MKEKWKMMLFLESLKEQVIIMAIVVVMFACLFNCISVQKTKQTKPANQKL